MNASILNSAATGRGALFKDNYTLMSELAITDRSEGDAAKFANQEVFKSSMVFSEKVEDFTDSDFWGEHNIIEPEESIENAIKEAYEEHGEINASQLHWYF
ncbi:MAG: hypothetical protein MZV63_36690 [Marinilabiliales bacterium]|nr:hypothetical protein [Marinilabiliales bacterium]